MGMERLNNGGGDVFGSDHGLDLGCELRNVVRRGRSLGFDLVGLVMRCAGGGARVHGDVICLGRHDGWNVVFGVVEMEIAKDWMHAVCGAA
ncbi:hypothetical protein RRF57_012469 [Xylaria bambusicola]|uniref:Uncharacterized protein n=1 Tax=Xylaria bambusicola TaxID=326684 RepID=A0AAN7ZAR0_9PEZI